MLFALLLSPAPSSAASLASHTSAARERTLRQLREGLRRTLELLAEEVEEAEAVVADEDGEEQEKQVREHMFFAFSRVKWPAASIS